MSNPTITAVITAEDKASATLRAFAKLAASTAKELEHIGAAKGLGNLPGQFDKATEAANRHASALHKVANAMKGLAGLAATKIAANFPHVATDAVKHYMPIEREMIAMKAAGGYSDAQMKVLADQQTQLAQRYGEKPEAVAHAQGEFVKRHMDAATTAAMTEEATKLAKALGTTAQRGAQILEGMIFGTGNHVTTPEEAHRLGKRFSDIATTQAKKGAMSADDIDAAWKYSGAATTAAHISPEQVAATQMLLKREQFGGDESGVFMRQLAARVMMPTNEGRIALQAAGINYDKFVSPGQMQAKNLNLALAERGQKELPQREIDRLQKAFDDGSLKSKAEFGAAVRKSYERSYGDTKAKDLNTIANTSGRFFEASKGQVDGGALWREMLKRMSPQQILEYLGTKQGAKGVSAIQQMQAANEYEEALKNAGGVTDKIAAERMTGLAAAVDRMSATYENMANKFVEANAPVLTALATLATSATAYASGMSDGNKWIVQTGAAVAALLVAAKGYSVALETAGKALGAGAAAQGAGAAAGAAGAGAAGAAAGAAGAGAAGAAAGAAGAGAAGAAAGVGAEAGAAAGAAGMGFLGFATMGAAVVAAITAQLLDPENVKRGMVHGASPDVSNTDSIGALPGVDPHAQASGENGRTFGEMLRGMTEAIQKFVAAHQPKPSPGYDPNAPFPQLPGVPVPANDAGEGKFAGALRRLTEPQEVSVKSDVTVNGQVSGEAQVVSNITVEVTGLDRAVGHAVQRVALPVAGKLRTGETMSGSNAPKGGPSSSMFKPTLTGY